MQPGNYCQGRGKLPKPESKSPKDQQKNGTERFKNPVFKYSMYSQVLMEIRV
jgi:hypothetical protein